MPAPGINDSITPPRSIEALAVAAQSGDSSSFDELVRRMEPRVRGFLTTRVQSVADADDLVQETFIRAQENLAKYDNRYKFSTWLFTIARNLATSHHRRTKHHGGEPERLSAPVSHDARNSLADRDAGAQLWKQASETLPAKHYLTLWLRYGEDLDVGEIAEKLGKSRTSVRVSLYRSRRRLAAMLAADDKRRKST